MGVYEARGQLAKLHKQLLQQWMVTRDQWRDSQADALEKNLLQQIDRDLRQAGTAMDSLAVLLGQVKRDCGE